MSRSHTLWSLLLSLLLVGCPGSTDDNPGCARVPGCEQLAGSCCEAATRCRELVCQGVGWTCVQSGASYGWLRGSAPQCHSGIDGNLPPKDSAPRRDADDATPDSDGPLDGTPADQSPADQSIDKGCACAPGSSQACGPCNKGTRACKTDCSGYQSCSVPSSVCTPNATKGCPNNCGDQTCSSSCSWGSCSRAGQPISKSGQTCFSTNHCGPNDGRCVACWMVCNGDGSLRRDSWCASCSDCGAEQGC